LLNERGGPEILALDFGITLLIASHMKRQKSLY